ncbi:MAG TPA: S41 family peptidase, partial [Verrucomicrobiota bacterium]|nr:S41 family peptidase [Verrucomicrobiota bacterium]
MKDFKLQIRDFRWPAACVLLALTLAARAAEPPPWPPVAEVLEAVRTNLPAVDEQRLRAGAVQGLLASLAPDVLPEAAAATNPPVARLRVYDGAHGYLRVGTVDAALPAELAAARAALARTNSLRGLVLDLRFAGGTDFAAVPAAAALFTGTNRPALRLAGQTLEPAAEAAAPPPDLPVMLLVNRQTAGAAEALAAAVRAGAARTLALGAITAGQARDYRTVTLSTALRRRAGRSRGRPAAGRGGFPAGPGGDRGPGRRAAVVCGRIPRPAPRSGCAARAPALQRGRPRAPPTRRPAAGRPPPVRAERRNGRPARDQPRSAAAAGRPGPR